MAAATGVGPADGKRGWPQCRQKRAPALAGLPQAGHVIFKGCPHCSQNRASSSLTEWQVTQIMALLPWHASAPIIDLSSGEDKRHRAREVETGVMDYAIMCTVLRGGRGESLYA